MATADLMTAYQKLGIGSNASKAEVKEAFVRLCKLHHPDKVPAAQRVAAEARFKDIKNAYDTILRGQAGYNVPPPGSKPNPKYAREYYRAHGMGMDFGEGGPIRCGGPFGGFATETDFYRSMFRATRNNPFVIVAAGLLAIPSIAVVVALASGETSWIRRFADEGLHFFSLQGLRANGRRAVGGINPFAIRKLEDIEDSYMYKDPKFAHLRKGISEATTPRRPNEVDNNSGAPAPA